MLLSWQIQTPHAALLSSYYKLVQNLKVHFASEMLSFVFLKNFLFCYLITIFGSLASLAIALDKVNYYFVWKLKVQ
jgi:hypothetical protein